MSKESKQNQEKFKASFLLKLPSIYLSSEQLQYHPIQRDRGSKETRGNEVPWSWLSANYRLCGLNQAKLGMVACTLQKK